MPSFLCVIRGQPGHWEGVAVDSGLAIQGPSFEQVRRCLIDIAPERRANRPGRIEGAFQQMGAAVRRELILARHFASAARRQAGLGGRARQSYMIRCPG